MAIVENSAGEIGDVILIQAMSPIFGILQLTGYTDTTIGENATRYFEKKFSYSIDGIFFSDWIDLTIPNILQIVVNASDAFYINYRYTRVGPDPTGIISFVDITLSGEFAQPLCQNYFVLPKSIFNDLFCYNPEHAHLCAILTNKLFEKGILPEYIERNQTDNPQVDDEDFLSFWGTVCCFYALILLYAKKLENFSSFEELLKEYLKERGIYFCNDTEIQDLQYIKSNYFDEIRQRGTFQIFVPKGTDGKVVNGEFLRLICYNINEDEFLVELLTGDKIGWWLKESSPCYKGTSFSTQLSKGKNKTDDILTLTNFVTYPNGASMVLTMDGPKSVVKIGSVSGGTIAGFSPDLFDIPSTDFTNAIVVDERMDYEITFWCKQDVLEQNISFGVYGFDINNNLQAIQNITTGSASISFFTKQSLNKTGIWYFVRGILYNKLQPNLSTDDARLNIGFGNNLRMTTGVSKIIPYIVLDREDVGGPSPNLFLWGIQVRPLVKGMVANTIYDDFTQTPTINNKPLFGSFSTGFLTTRNFLHITYKNNNTSITEEEVDKITREKLIPYNSVLKTTIIKKV